MSDDLPAVFRAKEPEKNPAGAADQGAPSPPLLDLRSSIPLAAPRMWTRLFTILCGAVVLGFVFLLRESAAVLETELPLLAWTTPVFVLLMLLSIRRLLLPRQRREIFFRDEHLELPRSPNSRRTYHLRYDEIRTIVPLVSRGQPALVIDGPKKVHIFVASDFPHPDLWRVLWAQILERIGELPEAMRQLRAMQELSRLSQETSAVGPRFTKRLFWVIAAVFAAQTFLAPPVDVLAFLYFGANSPAMVFGEGQWWRVVTANLLHGNLLHFGVNAFALYFLGTYCERLFGEPRTIVLILATAVAGALASLFGAGALFSVGISTALFGLLGAYLAIHLRFGAQLPPPYRQSQRWWLIILGLNVVLSIAVPVIDAWGHFGGFFAGLLLGWLMLRRERKYSPRPESGRAMNLSAAALVALFTFCAFLAISYAVGDHPEDEIVMAQAVLERADVDEPAMLIQIARQWSRHEPRPAEVDPILVELLRKGQERTDDLFLEWRAVATMIEIAEARDPFDEELMEEAVRRFDQLAHRYDDAEAQQALLRLLMTYYHERRTPLLGFPPPNPFESARWENDHVRLGPADSVPSAKRVRLLAHENGRSTYLLTLCVAADQSPPQAVPEQEISRELQLSVALVVDVAGCAPHESERWQVTPFVPRQ